MRPGCIRSAASSATAGRNGTAGFATTCAAFFKGDNGTVRCAGVPADSAARISIGDEEREAEQSVNFVTCHDGFTLNDLVSFNSKHNEANGEGNRDGADDNLQLELRCRGPDRGSRGRAAAQPPDQELPDGDPVGAGHADAADGRRGAAHARAATTTPIARTTKSCWFDWTLVERHADIHRFVKELIAFRMNRELPVERLDMTLNELLRRQPVQWHGVKLGCRIGATNLTHWRLRSACLDIRCCCTLSINAYWEALEFDIPLLDRPQEAWRRVRRYLPRSAGRYLSVGRCSDC